MSNHLTAVRRRIHLALRAKGFNVFEVLPEVVTPPCVWIAPDDPYTTREGATFRGLIVRLQVNFAAAAGVNDAAAEALDALALDVQDALEEIDDLHVGDIGRVGVAPLNAQEYLAASIAVQTEIHRS